MKKILYTTLFAGILTISSQAYARDYKYDRDDNHPGWRGGYGARWENHPGRSNHWGPTDKRHYVKHVEKIYYYTPKHRTRYYRDKVITRPHGRWYHGYGNYHNDRDAYKWLSFTAITLKLLDNMNEQQQRSFEQAQVQATSANVGDVIYWNNNGASGSVMVVNDGTSSEGRYCREFQQTVMIGSRKEEAYGTACMQPDGSWEKL